MKPKTCQRASKRATKLQQSFAKVMHNNERFASIAEVPAITGDAFAAQNGMGIVFLWLAKFWFIIHPTGNRAAVYLYLLWKLVFVLCTNSKHWCIYVTLYFCTFFIMARNIYWCFIRDMLIIVTPSLSYVLPIAHSLV